VFFEAPKNFVNDLPMFGKSGTPSVAKVQFSSVQGVNSPNQNQNQVYKVRTRTKPNQTILNRFNMVQFSSN
jgi:hypothetical protein